MSQFSVDAVFLVFANLLVNYTLNEATMFLTYKSRKFFDNYLFFFKNLVPGLSFGGKPLERCCYFVVAAK